MMIANEWSDFETGESGAGYLWPSWNDRRGFVTVTRQPAQVEVRLQYRGAASAKMQADWAVSGAGENQLYNNWLTLLRQISATYPDMPEDYSNFISAVSGTVAAFAGSGRR